MWYPVKLLHLLSNITVQNSEFYVKVYWLRNMNQVSTTKQWDSLIYIVWPLCLKSSCSSIGQYNSWIISATCASLNYRTKHHYKFLAAAKFFYLKFKIKNVTIKSTIERRTTETFEEMLVMAETEERPCINRRAETQIQLNIVKWSKNWEKTVWRSTSWSHVNNYRCRRQVFLSRPTRTMNRLHG